MTPTASGRYVVPVPRVQYSVQVLLELDIHPFFPGYMALRRQAALQGTMSEIEPKWADLGEFLFVAGAPANRPFLRPFWEGPNNAGQEWLNKNLAGSYAPSSLRAAPLTVVDAHDQVFELKKGHANLAKMNLLKGQRLPGLAVAAFMLRDREILAEGPTSERLISAFGYEFGYRDSDLAEFETLYDCRWRGEIPDSPWLVQAEED